MNPAQLRIKMNIRVFSVSNWELVIGHVSYVGKGNQNVRRFWPGFGSTLLLPLDAFRSSLPRVAFRFKVL